MPLFDVDGNPEFEWTPFHEVHLISAMGGIRFLGINKHFQLARIFETFYASVGNGTGITREELIRKLKTYYNLNFEKRVFTDLFPVEDFSLDSSWLRDIPFKDSDIFTDESSMGSKSESESLSNSGGESCVKRGKSSAKKENPGRRSVAATTTPRKSEVKSKEEPAKKTPASKKRAGSALKEPPAKKMRVKD